MSWKYFLLAERETEREWVQEKGFYNYILDARERKSISLFYIRELSDFRKYFEYFFHSLTPFFSLSSVSMRVGANICWA